MIRWKTRAVIVFAACTISLTAIAVASSRKSAFGFNAPEISGFTGGGVVALTGGGAYDLDSHFVHSGGGFRCTTAATTGPLSGCQAGEGVRWDTADVLASSGFKCTGAAGEAGKTATTNDHTAVLLADFYRQGDGVNESFTAKIIVSDLDLDPVLPGVQNVWIQGVGCGSAVANFN